MSLFTMYLKKGFTVGAFTVQLDKTTITTKEPKVLVTIGTETFVLTPQELEKLQITQRMGEIELDDKQFEKAQRELAQFKAMVLPELMF